MMPTPEAWAQIVAAVEEVDRLADNNEPALNQDVALVRLFLILRQVVKQAEGEES